MKILQVSGNHKEIGKVQGEIFKENILSYYNTHIKPVLKRKKKIFKSYRRYERETAESLLSFYIPLYENIPGFMDKFSGLSEGSGFIPTKLSLTNFIEFSNDVIDKTIQSISITLLPEKSYYRTPMIFYILYGPPELSETLFVRKSSPEGSLKSLELSMVFILGSFVGCNENGLCASANFIKAKPGKSFSPTVLLQHVLEECENLECAISLISNFSEILEAKFSIMKGNKLVVVEASEKGMEKIYPEKGFYINDGLIPWKDYESDEFLKDIVTSVKLKKQRIEKLLVRKERLTSEDLISISMDHGPEFHPSKDTICAHSENLSTIGCVLLLPSESLAKVTFGNPCRNVYRVVRFR